MPQHIGDLYRSGLTNFVATETNASSLQINGTAREGVWLFATHQGVTGGTSAVQTMHATGSPSSGAYTITIGGQVATLQWNASVAAILAAIYNLKNVLLNNILYATVPLGAVTSTTVAATGYAAGDVNLTFGGAWANQPITPTIQAGTSNVNTPSVTSTTPGVGVTCAITAQGNDDNSATWIAGIPDFGTLYVPASASLPGVARLSTPFKYVSFTLTFGGSGTNLKNLQVGLRPYQEGVN